MPIAYQYYADGNFAGEIETFGRLPHNATETPPPALPWTRQWPVFADGEWKLVEDHRERPERQYGENLAQPATEYWLPEDNWQSQARKMDKVGSLPAGALLARPGKPKPTLEEAKADAIARIDKATSNAILAGFDYEIDAGKGKEKLHFSYDSFDQQNFADSGIVARLAASGTPGVPSSVTWNAYRNWNTETGGELVRLELDPAGFLQLYTAGALAHKAMQMEIGGQRKATISDMKAVTDVENLLAEWGI